MISSKEVLRNPERDGLDGLDLRYLVVDALTFDGSLVHYISEGTLNPALEFQLQKINIRPQWLSKS